MPRKAPKEVIIPSEVYYPLPRLTKEQVREAKKVLEEACADLPPPREDIYAYAEYWRKKQLEEHGEFCCPLCGSKEFEERTGGASGFGQAFSTPVIGYACRGCSIHFGDPKKFTHALDHSLREHEGDADP